MLQDHLIETVADADGGDFEQSQEAQRGNAAGSKRPIYQIRRAREDGALLRRCFWNRPRQARAVAGVRLRSGIMPVFLRPDPMVVDLKSTVVDLLRQALADVAPKQASVSIVLERPKQAAHGDFATNLALQLAKPLKLAPRDIASRIVAELPPSPWLAKAEVAGAGFINLFLTDAAKQHVVRAVCEQSHNYGRSRLGHGKKVQVEFVSANPTGPLHVGHGRGAAYGASLANLLDFAGYRVTREFYINDAGRQMDILALSTWLRYLELYSVNIAFPPNCYQGDYVADMARQIREVHGDRYVRYGEALFSGVPSPPPAGRDDADAERAREAHLDTLITNAKELLGDDYAYIHQHALSEQLADCREDLAEFGVHFDVWFSEKSLFDTGLIDRALEQLEKRGHIYFQDGAAWFRSSAFGDEKDRVVKRENGQYTYFASDIAYHLNKHERGFDKIIDIWGADHHGYIARVKGALEALGLDPRKLEVALVQFAVLYRAGQKTPMSTRAGEFVTLRQLRQEVGNDAARFFYVLRKSDQHLDFDLDLAKSQSADNPVYYVQYAHARVCSVLRQWGGKSASLADADVAPLDSDRELSLCGRLMEFPEVIESAAQEEAPHQVAFYLKELAAEFHSYYNAERILVDDPAQRNARLALAAAVRQVLCNGLQLLGVSTPEAM
jgi:arginyl-tRNA synthetase